MGDLIPLAVPVRGLVLPFSSGLAQESPDQTGSCVLIIRLGTGHFSTLFHRLYFSWCMSPEPQITLFIVWLSLWEHEPQESDGFPRLSFAVSLCPTAGPGL